MAVDGVLLIDKEEGMTSFETVRKVRGTLGVRKAGHAGTLDKAASGLLLVCINRATAVQNILMGSSKRYSAVIRLGTETDTLDRYGRVVKTGPVPRITKEKIERALENFRGPIRQTPPLFSAIHHEGERLYKKAMKGERPSVKPRDVVIHELVLSGFTNDTIEIEAYASKGTYIRSLGRDIADSLGTCGSLTSLRRLSIGPFSVVNAVRLRDIDGPEAVVPLEEALGYLPAVEVGEEEASMVKNGIPPGRALKRHWAAFGSLELSGPRPVPGLDSFSRVMSEGRLIAIVTRGRGLGTAVGTGQNTALRYFKVFKDG
ncbi:MAG: tRNA pseudouridine(55) synthase TruB [Spirochaetes bacterium]|nr:tRNA pseudouridine(55) synthase TruB [Spirochaetota bacterium]